MYGFLSSIFFILSMMFVYVFLGYPFLIYLVAIFKTKFIMMESKGDDLSITIIIAARNEEAVIKKKILNTLSLDYPANRFEIIVVSDQSSDKTDSIIRSFKNKRIRLISLKDRLGKTGAQNIAVKEAKGDILVFSDANALYDKSALKNLVKHFENSKVGCVSGELCYRNPQNAAVGVEENWYWKYEKWIKKSEDKVGTIIGANGSIYAVRRIAYIPLERNIISDFIEPLEISYQGWRVVYEPEAISFEESSKTFEDELNRKERIISRSLYSLIQHKHLLNPFHNIILFFELISHKLLRWATPILLILMFMINMFLFSNITYRILFWMQITFYGFSIIGFIFRNLKIAPSFILAPYYFCLLQYASLKGVCDVIRGKLHTFWDPIRQDNSNV